MSGKQKELVQLIVLLDQTCLIKVVMMHMKYYLNLIYMYH